MIIKQGLTRINFIDEHEQFFGVEHAQQCCEDFHWMIFDKDSGRTIVNDESFEQEATSLNPEELLLSGKLEGYYFPNNFLLFKDRGWFEDEDNDEVVASEVRILMVHEGNKPDLVLLVENTHNGCYTHEWGFSQNGEVVDGDEL